MGKSKLKRHNCTELALVIVEPKDSGEALSTTTTRGHIKGKF